MLAGSPIPRQKRLRMMSISRTLLRSSMLEVCFFVAVVWYSLAELLTTKLFLCDDRFEICRERRQWTACEWRILIRDETWSISSFSVDFRGREIRRNCTDPRSV
ncbi:hypothetical protein QBC45DRAFT_407171 [Copromyces sp. CBS 386.78]|nr:hypothetical protein QBC45DRAFT_407171 [Copromyces sp. CBS 386.78]